MSVTVIRQEFYNGSWPLYFGYFDPKGHNERTEVLVVGDGPISLTAMNDLGLANALLLVEDGKKWAGKMFYCRLPRRWLIH